MDAGDFKKWRKQLRLNQFEAAQLLSVSRGAVQHWESEHIDIPHTVELACHELTRRWKQRPEFGPVILVYADGPMWERPGEARRMLILQCEPYSNNASAIERACQLGSVSNVINVFIVEDDMGIVWACPELQRECERRRSESQQPGEQLSAEG
jgi:DNA-binding XRE family transcriptional regulator